MSSIKSAEYIGRRTRLQEANEKRKATELLKQNAELKRKRKMFAPRKVIGPRDILVNSNIPKIKLEDDVGCSSSVKQETLENQPTISVKVGESIEQIQSVENFADFEMDIEDKVVVASVMNESDIAAVNLCSPSDSSSASILSCSSSRSSSVILIQPCTTTEQNEIASVIDSNINDKSAVMYSIELEESTFLENHIKSLKVFVGQKDKEINQLVEFIKNIRCRLAVLDHEAINENPKTEVNGDFDPQFNSNFGICSFSTDKKRLATQLTSGLKARNIKIKRLTTKMIRLQNDLFLKMDKNLQIVEDNQVLQHIILESFTMVLPFIYPELKIKHLLACRNVCHDWRNAIDKYLNNHPTIVPFNTKMKLAELRLLEMGRIRKSKESPLDELAKIYTFSDLRALDIFTDDKMAKIVGSRIILDNIILDDPLAVFRINKLIKFLDTHGSQIKHLEIRQNIESADFNLSLFMDRAQLCMRELSKLKSFKITFCIDAEKMESENGWDTLATRGIATYDNWQIISFPKLEFLESLIFDIEILEGWTLYANFLRNFCKSVIRPYSEQLKKLDIFAHSIGYNDCFVVPNLKELTIPQRFVEQKLNFGLENLEKLSITSCVSKLKNQVIQNVHRLFPKLVCLGFKFESDNGKFAKFHETPLTPEWHDVIFLELENCDSVPFRVLQCFPNLRYIKVINKYSTRIEDSDDATCLQISKILSCKKELYCFSDRFPKITVVTLEFTGEPLKNIKPKKFTWTEE